MIRIIRITLAAGLVCAHLSAEQIPAPGALAEFDHAFQSWSGSGFSRAVEQLRRERDQHPESAGSHYWLGVAHFHRMLHQRYENPPDEPAAAKSAEMAEICFEKVLTIDPNHAEAHALLGTLLGMKIDGLVAGVRLGPKVQRHQQEALRLGPANPRVRYLLGSGLYHTAENHPEKLRTALRTLEYAAKLFSAEAAMPAQPGSPRWGASSCQTFIGRCHEALGDFPQAIMAYRRALALHPADHLAGEAVARLEKILPSQP